MVDSSGTVVSNEYYYPYGGNRGAAHSTLTTKRFTGQYHEAGLPGGEGLSYYNARWYDAQLGRFVSADTIVPIPMNPQAFNRMAYVENNPIRNTDPSGHRICIDADCTEFEPVKATGGGGSHSPGNYPPPNRPAIGTGPYPADVTLSFDRVFDIPFTNGGTHSIFGNEVYYSSIAAKEEAFLILGCWWTEICGPEVYFGPYSAFTQSIRASPELQSIRENWTTSGHTLPYREGVPVDAGARDPNLTPSQRLIVGMYILARENLELGATMLLLGSSSPSGNRTPVGGVIGSYQVNIYDTGGDIVLFEATNVTRIGSGTRIPGTNSALLEDQPQSAPGPGGDFTQYYYWWEPKPAATVR